MLEGVGDNLQGDQHPDRCMSLYTGNLVLADS